MDVLARCDRCGRLEYRLVMSYWGPSYCTICCVVICDLFDRLGEWPEEENGC